jgi:hypothetical protein
MRRPLEWLAALGLVAVASIAVATAPQDGTIADPFVRTGAVGEVVHGRDFDVEVLDVRLGESLDLAYDESGLESDGVWVVVDLVATANVDVVQLGYTELRINGVGYATHDLPYPSMDFVDYGAGIPVQGSIVFEVPKSALDGAGLDDARVYFQYGVDVQLDDIPEVIVDLRELDLERTQVVDAPFVMGVR